MIWYPAIFVSGFMLGWAFGPWIAGRLRKRRGRAYRELKTYIEESGEQE